MGDTEVHALDGISLTINKGEFVAIVGQSGSCLLYTSTQAVKKSEVPKLKAV